MLTKLHSRDSSSSILTRDCIFLLITNHRYCAGGISYKATRLKHANGEIRSSLSHLAMVGKGKIPKNNAPDARQSFELVNQMLAALQIVAAQQEGKS